MDVHVCLLPHPVQSLVLPELQMPQPEGSRGAYELTPTAGVAALHEQF